MTKKVKIRACFIYKSMLLNGFIQFNQIQSIKTTFFSIFTQKVSMFSKEERHNN